MEWSAEIDDLFAKVINKVPATFRPHVEPLLQETTEKKCLDRNSSQVNEADLVIALIEITPDLFQAEAIKNLKELGIDATRYMQLKAIRDEHKLNWEGIARAFHPGNYNFNLYLTYRCNQRCLHCAADPSLNKHELSTEKWVEIIDNLENSLKVEGRRGVYIWFGGEPTCRSDLHKLIAHCGDNDYFQAIATNGILFNEKFAKYCVDNGMSHVFVSFDSVDKERAARIRGSRKAFEYAERAINTALQQGLFVVATTTISKYNINEMAEIRAYVEGLGAIPYFRAVIKQRNAAKNWEEIGLTKEEYQRFYDFRNEHTIGAVRKGNAGITSMCMTFDMVPFLEHNLSEKEMTAIEWGVGCQACRSVSGIDINGDFFPCDYPSETVLGNVLRDGFSKIMTSQAFKDVRDRRRVGKCAACHHLSMCGGGCRVHAECETGNYFESYSYCSHDNDHELNLSRITQLASVKSDEIKEQ